MRLKQNIKIAVDAVVFGYRHNSLFVLLIQQKFGVFQNTWALPGGFVLDDEPLTVAVKRELREEAGIEVDYLEQLYTFGDNIHRDPRGRVITVAFFALVNPDKFELSAATDAIDADWFPLNKIPHLAYDHPDIIQMAFQRLKSKLLYQPIGFDLLQKEFPFSDLENLYSCILEQEIDRRNFRKKILSFGILEETEKMVSEGSGRPAMLFRFNKLKYRQLEKEGFNFEIKFA